MEEHTCTHRYMQYTVSLALSVDNSLGSASSTPVYESAHIHTVRYMQYYTGF